MKEEDEKKENFPAKWEVRSRKRKRYPPSQKLTPVAVEVTLLYQGTRITHILR
jgi:hypothetical protein